MDTADPDASLFERFTPTSLLDRLSLFDEAGQAREERGLLVLSQEGEVLVGLGHDKHNHRHVDPWVESLAAALGADTQPSESEPPESLAAAGERLAPEFRG